MAMLGMGVGGCCPGHWIWAHRSTPAGGHHALGSLGPGEDPMAVKSI
jgi:hypothetical protein